MLPCLDRRSLLLLAAGLAVLAGVGLWSGAPGRTWLIVGAEAACALAVAARALRPPNRLAWSLIALALVAWTAGDAIYAVDPALPVPSVADVAWLGYYVPAAAGLGLLMTSRVRRAGADAWLDGGIAALATAAIGAAAVLAPVAAGGGDGTLQLVVTLAYPVADMALLALVVVVVTVSGRRDAPFLLLAGGLALTALADGLYLGMYARGAWAEPSALEALWPAATLMIAAAAWMAPPDEPAATRSGLRQIVVPLAGGLAAVGVVLAGIPAEVSPLAIGLAAATLLLGTVRLALTFAEKERALAGLYLRATTDPLTELPNHREFHDRLRVEVERARRHGRALSVALIDLDRFKAINDTFGHPTGDRVLVHVSEVLRELVRPGDTLARVGGEEFGWILPETTALDAWQAVERARERLRARPEPRAGHIDFSAGICDLSEVSPPLGGPELVRLADGALYWAKHEGRGLTFRYSPGVVTALTAEELARASAREQSLSTVRALARAVDARDPRTLGHSERVAAIAEGIAAVLAWDEPRRRLLRDAALVHDIGTIAVPDEVLMKSGPLTRAERAVVEAHPAAGARIVAEALTDEQVDWIRSHHERPDGGGYPDRLTEADIPDGAMILAVADAYDAMTAPRAYRTPLSPAEAIAECRAHVGTQFWGPAVDALESLVARHGAEVGGVT